MKFRELTDSSLNEANTLYKDRFAGKGSYALLTFSDNNACMLNLFMAIRVLEAMMTGQAAPLQYSPIASHTAHMPTLRVLTPEEHRVHWLASYFNVSLSTMEGHCQYDVANDMEQQYSLNMEPDLARLGFPETTQVD